MIDMNQRAGFSSPLLAELRAVVEKAGPLLLAVSGGLDSRFLLHCCTMWKVDVIPAHFSGPHLTPQEQQWAHRLLEPLSPELFSFSPLDVEQARANTRERCYHCKRTAFALLQNRARQMGRVVADGTNASDLGTFRPGLRALQELGILSPLAMAGISKQQIRKLGARIGFPLPDQPARACLLTRFAYGVVPDSALLQQLGRAEDSLAAMGLRDFRIRVGEDGGYILQTSETEQDIVDQLQHRVWEVMRGLAPVWKCVSSAQVSGFFDTSS